MNGPEELLPLLAALRSQQAGPARAALVTLTQTRGPTFRRTGTRMLVRADGSSVCALSGGCPQHDIVTRAMEVIADGQARQVRYDHDSGLDVLMEMGCGGTLEVLIEPVDGTREPAWVTALANCLERRRPGRMATVYARDDKVLPPRHALWCEDSLLYDGIDDKTLLEAIREHADAPSGQAFSTVIDNARGRFSVLVDPLIPPPALVVIGSSATARALLSPALGLGWVVHLVDFDADRLRDVPVPEGTRKLVSHPDGLVASLAPDAATSVVVMTHNLEKDAEYLAALQGIPLTYLGLLGARARVRRVLARAGIEEAAVHGPVGLDIGSESPAEIALSILAEILATIRRRPGGPLRTTTGSFN